MNPVPRSGPVAQPGSSSIEQPEYWWYRARTELLASALGRHLAGAATVLDVGSADGPSVAWMRGRVRHVNLDLDPRGLVPDEGVCGSAEALPFRGATFDAVGAFDVVEHCASERRALAELCRVLVPGGRLLLSVPAYQWAWSDHDERAGHYRRYTRRQIVEALEGSGFVVDRATHAFTATFPLFALERLVRKLRSRAGRPPEPGLVRVSTRTDRLLMRLSGIDRWLLRRRDLPFGSSVFVAAHKPSAAGGH